MKGSSENPLSGGVRKALAFRGGSCLAGTTHPYTPEGVKKFERPPHPPSATAVASGTLSPRELNLMFTFPSPHRGRGAQG